jgi:LPS export ABC transporter protein LptC
LSLVMWGCGRPSSGEAEKVSAAPDQIIGQFTMDNFTGKGREWTLESPKAYVFEPQERVDVDAPHIRFYDEGKPGALLEAGKGRFHTGRKDLRAWDGVVMISTDGARLESDWMNYDAVQDLVTSTAPVTVTRGRSVLRGIGWEAKPDMSRVVVRKQRVEIFEADRPKKK